MAQYRIDGNAAILTTAAPDGTYSHPSGERGTWNGFAVPHATFAELLAYSEASLALGHRFVFRPVLIDGELLALMFPCDGECDAVSSGDFWPLGDGEHAHHDDAHEWYLETETEAVYVDGLIWEAGTDEACYVCGSAFVTDHVSQDANAGMEYMPVCDAHPWGSDDPEQFGL